MEFKTVLFWIFSSIAVISALLVVTCRNPVHAALYLVLTFFNIAGIWLLLEAEFLAITLVLVYVGAVMVLFLFVVMMLDVNIDELRSKMKQHSGVAGLVGSLILLELTLVIWKGFGSVKLSYAPAANNTLSNTAVLGQKLYTEYLYPFELAAVLLLVAIIAAISLTLRKRKDSKYFSPAEAVRVKASDRLKIVKVTAETDRAQAKNNARPIATPTPSASVPAPVSRAPANPNDSGKV